MCTYVTSHFTATSTVKSSHHDRPCLSGKVLLTRHRPGQSSRQSTESETGSRKLAPNATLLLWQRPGALRHTPLTERSKPINNGSLRTCTVESSRQEGNVGWRGQHATYVEGLRITSSDGIPVMKDLCPAYMRRRRASGSCTTTFALRTMTRGVRNKPRSQNTAWESEQQDMSIPNCATSVNGLPWPPSTRVISCAIWVGTANPSQPSA